jgi:hypothetical protein
MRNAPEPAELTPDLHDEDFYSWAMETARALRERRFERVDWNSVAEELEDMGRSEKRELTNRLAVLLTHLLKWQVQPNRRSRSWILTILEQRRQAARMLRDNPSFRALQDEILADAYGDAALLAAQETGLDSSSFPDQRPWTLAQILDAEFLPGELANS